MSVLHPLSAQCTTQELVSYIYKVIAARVPWYKRWFRVELTPEEILFYLSPFTSDCSELTLKFLKYQISLGSVIHRAYICGIHVCPTDYEVPGVNTIDIYTRHVHAEQYANPGRKNYTQLPVNQYVMGTLTLPVVDISYPYCATQIKPTYNQLLIRPKFYDRQEQIVTLQELRVQLESQTLTELVNNVGKVIYNVGDELELPISQPQVVSQTNASALESLISRQFGHTEFPTPSGLHHYTTYLPSYTKRIIGEMEAALPYFKPLNVEEYIAQLKGKQKKHYLNMYEKYKLNDLTKDFSTSIEFMLKSMEYQFSEFKGKKLRGRCIANPHYLKKI